jgi:hypothetical protein
VERVAPSDIGLRERTVGRILFPRRIGKAAILGIGCKRAGARYDAAELGKQRHILTHGQGRIAERFREQHLRRLENVLSAHTDQRIGRQGVCRSLVADVMLRCVGGTACHD